MLDFHHGLLGTLAILTYAAPHGRLAAQDTGSENTDEAREDTKRLRSLAAEARLSPYGVVQLASELARRNTALQRANVDESAKIALADILTVSHLQWQQDRRSAIHENELIQTLNREFELEQFPEHLQVRHADVRRVRLGLWANYPELTEGPPRKGALVGKKVFHPAMSPIEAYLVADMVMASKVSNPSFVKPANHKAVPPPTSRSTPRMFLRQVDPDNLRLELHLAAVVQRKWRTVEDFVASVNATLGGRRGQ